MPEKLIVSSDRSVAVNSPDHLQPWGTARDSSRNALFNEKIYKLFAGRPEVLKILDLGCSGGGFVRDCIDDGCYAVGIEGSDYSQKMSRAEWATLSDKFLFTADLTSKFEVSREDETGRHPIEFDLITSWDVLEHIAENDLPTLIENIKRHLKSDGLAIFSISNSEEVINGIRLHQTVQPKDWWVNLFQSHGLTNLPKFEQYFGGQYIRGPKYGAPFSFHVALSIDTSAAPEPFSLNRKDRIFDHWYGSRPYWWIRRRLGIPD